MVVITPTVRQVLSSSALGLILAGLMSTWGYPAAALPQMEQLNSNIHFTKDQSSWFATVTLLMSIPGSVIGASACELVGPRKLFLILTPILGLSFIIMISASWKEVQSAGFAEIILLSARVVQGSVVALLVPAGSVYMYEIGDHRLRGVLTSLVEIWYTWGFLLCYITNCFMSWQTIAWVLPVTTLVPGYIGMVFSPESPLWLARKGKPEEAKMILKRLRSTSQEALQDLKVESANIQDSMTFSENIRVIWQKPHLLSMIASSTTTIMKELTGFAVIMIYMVHIFDAAGVGLDPRYSSVIVGVVRLICNIIASALLHNFRRKILLITGCALTGCAAIVLGIFFYLKESGHEVNWLAWLPLVGLATHMLGSAAAIGPTTWLMAVEVLPGPVRNVGFGASVTCFACAGFLISKTFVELQNLIGMYGVFWIFAGGAFAYILIAIFCLPETFKKSLQDIEDHWNNASKSKQNNSENSQSLRSRIV